MSSAMSATKAVKVYSRFFRCYKCAMIRDYVLTPSFLLLQAAAESRASFRPMDLVVFGSPGHAEEEEATPTMAIVAQPNVPEE